MSYAVNPGINAAHAAILMGPVLKPEDQYHRQVMLTCKDLRGDKKEYWVIVHVGYLNAGDLPQNLVGYMGWSSLEIFGQSKPGSRHRWRLLKRNDRSLGVYVGASELIKGRIVDYTS
ncbi:hypothetical protein AURDEDRAFT_177744 [Auricularia subglabra TFB-10046 SS5]|uniref:Uncharacterized protein n=1 Tax=Auricularia subglabra (strain TFB-10046 / SS5) TaxID=717982 RepID=J0WLH8_AURST|nr:hypothetical protein AURDEDRAFT_177744 [Auricularia subglabra TFB-10046 SS5]